MEATILFRIQALGAQHCNAQELVTCEWACIMCLLYFYSGGQGEEGTSMVSEKDDVTYMHEEP